MEKTEDEVETVIAELVESPPAVKLTKAERRGKQAHERIRAVEDLLLERAQSVVSYTLDFMEIAFPEDDSDDAKLHAVMKNEELKRKWAEEMDSRDKAEQRFRVAQAGWSRAAEMPGAIKVAQETYMGITKTRAKEISIHIGQINGTFINLPMAASAAKLLEED